MSGSPDTARHTRLAEVIGAVVRQALRDWGVTRVALADDGSPEAGLCLGILQGQLGDESVVPVRAADLDVESLLRILPAGATAERAGSEFLRTCVRLVPDAIPALACNKTTLLLGGPLPPEPLLPLGDLYASEVATLAGGWSGPAEVTAIAEAAGGIEALDAALRRRIDRRDPAGLLALGQAAEQAEQALRRGRASRITPRIVPKIGLRTLGVDLFE